MRKLLVVFGAAAMLALAAAVLGALLAAYDARRGAGQVVQEEDWSLGPVALRSEEEYRRAADGFRARFQWLLPEEAEEPVDVATEQVEAEPPVNLPPPPPVWRVVGVLLEAADPGRYALVAEAGRVTRYRVGDAFMDGTRLLAVHEQSVRVAKNGEERDVHLYRPQ